jgi:hypothetical protein
MRASLTDTQRRQIVAAAIGVRPAARMTFINDVECHLDPRCHGRSPSDADISKAIEATLDTTPFWPKSVFLCDSQTQEAAMWKIDLDDEDDFETITGIDGKLIRVLKDGRSIKVPLFLRDGAINPDLNEVQRAMALDAVARRNASHRPGFRYGVKDAAARDARRQSYIDYETELQTAYQNPPNNESTGFGSRGPVDKTGEGTVGSSCTVRNLDFPDHTGEPGTLQRIDGRIVCVPDDYNWTDGLSAREIAHIEYLDHITNAWRHPNGDVASDSIPAPRRPDVSTKDAATLQREHTQNMSQIYSQLDAELSEKWRNP